MINLDNSITRAYADVTYLRLDGTNSPTANIDWNGQDITNANAIYVTDDFYVGTVGLNDNGTDAGCGLVGIQTIGSPTWTNQCEFNSLFGSAGRASGGAVTADGTDFDIALGTGFIKATDSDTADLLSFDWTALTGQTIASGERKYVGVKYNGGSPTAEVRATNNYDADTEFPLASVIRENGTLHILNNPWWVTDGITNIIQRFRAEGYVIYDRYYGGARVADEGSRTISITGCKLWSLFNEFPIAGIDTSGTDTIEYYWYNGVTGSWNQSDVTQWSGTQWNDTTQATLQTLNNNYYYNTWVYAEADDQNFSLIYAQNQYTTLAQAEAEGEPSILPAHISAHGILIARITSRQGTDASVEITSYLDRNPAPSIASTHNNLAGLQGGVAEQYYHLNASNYTELTAWLADVTLSDGGAMTIGGDLTVSKSFPAIYALDGTDGLAFGWGGTSAQLAALSGAGFSPLEIYGTIITLSATSIIASGTISASNLSGTNTGDQTSIVGITGTKAQFDTAVTDGNFAYAGGAYHDGFSDYVSNEHIDWTNSTSNLLTTGTVTGSNLAITNWNTAYSHSQDNTQAHSDYLINNGDDTTSGTLTAANFFTTGNITIDSDSNKLILGADQDGTIYHDGTRMRLETTGSQELWLNPAGATIAFGRSSNFGLQIYQSTFTEQLQFCVLDNVGNSFIFTNTGNLGAEHGLAPQTNPTIAIFDDTATNNLLLSTSTTTASIISDTGAISFGNENISTTGNTESASYSVGGTAGATGTFTSVTVVNGIVTSGT